MHRFLFRVRPTAAVVDGNDIAGAIAQVWINDSDPATAEIAARGVVMDDGWLIDELRSVIRITPEQSVRLDTTAAACYRQAAKRGTFLLLSAWPIDQVRDEDVLEVRSSPPLSPPRSKQ